MKYICYAIIVLSNLHTICLATSNPPYYGLRVTMSQYSFREDILYFMQEGFNKLGTHFYFQDILEIFGEGLFAQGIIISNISTNNLEFSYKGVENSSSEWTGSEFRTDLNASISLNISFNWKFQLLYIYPLFGTGTGRIETSSISTEVNFTQNPKTQSKINCRLKAKWAIKNLGLNGLHHIAYIGEWMERLFPIGMEEDMRNILENVSDHVSNNLLKTYKESRTPMERDNIYIVIVIKNELFSTVESNSHIVLQFRTNITVEGFPPYNIYIWRFITPIAKGENDLEICMNYELIPDTLEILGKARYFNLPLTDIFPKIGKVNMFAGALPVLLEMFPSEMDVNIGCTACTLYDILDLQCSSDVAMVPPDPYCHLMLIPINCIFATDDLVGATFISVQIFARANYYPQLTENGGFKANLSYVYLYQYIYTPALSVTAQASINSILEDIIGDLNGQEVLSPGLRVKPNRANDYSLTGRSLYEEHACWEYNDQHKI